MLQRIVVLLLLVAGPASLPLVAAPGDTAPQTPDTETARAPAAAPGEEEGEDPAGEGLIDMNAFAEFRDVVVAYTGEGGWITWLQVFVVVFLALLLDFIQRRILKGLKKRLERTANPWDDALLDALTAPISLMIWVVGIALAAAFLDFQTRLVYDAIALTLIIAGAWFMVRLIKNMQANLIEISQSAGDEEDRWDPHTVDAIGRLVRLSVVITATLIALQHIGVNISAVLAFGGIGGIAIGFAAKDMLANFFGGLLLYLDHPFRAGDWIRSPDRSIEGTVEHIGWRITRIRTFDKRPLYVPNSIFSTIAIENPSRMANRRIKETIGIRYSDIGQMDAITKDVEAMLKNHPEIDTDQILMVYFNAFGPSSVDFFVYTFTRTTKWKFFHEVKHDVLIKISNIITGHGAEIAYPTSTLHIDSMPESDPGRAPDRPDRPPGELRA
jgi:MscS family membrane protein